MSEDAFKRNVEIMRQRQRERSADEALGIPTEPLSGHGCDGGFRYVNREDGTIAVEPCAECAAEKRLAQLEREIRASGIGDRYFTVEWDDLEPVEPMPRIREVCDRIADVIESGESALLHGAPGSGKTQAAVLLVKSAIRAGFTARMENLGRLAMNIRAGYDGDGPSEKRTVDELSAVDLLVLDDIGAGETMNAKIEQRILYLVTESRQNAVKPTIVTTNLAPTALAETVGTRITNRLQPVATIAFKHGRNFRRRTDDYGSVW